MEIQESASLQLGSDVTKFRVAAAEVGRQFVPSSERRDSRAEEYRISHIQGDIFARDSSALLSPLLRRRLAKFYIAIVVPIAKLILFLGAN